MIAAVRVYERCSSLRRNGSSAGTLPCARSVTMWPPVSSPSGRSDRRSPGAATAEAVTRQRYPGRHADAAAWGLRPAAHALRRRRGDRRRRDGRVRAPPGRRRTCTAWSSPARRASSTCTPRPSAGRCSRPCSRPARVRPCSRRSARPRSAMPSRWPSTRRPPARPRVMLITPYYNRVGADGARRPRARRPRGGGRAPADRVHDARDGRLAVAARRAARAGRRGRRGRRQGVGATRSAASCRS